MEIIIGLLLLGAVIAHYEVRLYQEKKSYQGYKNHYLNRVDTELMDVFKNDRRGFIKILFAAMSKQIVKDNKSYFNGVGTIEVDNTDYSFNITVSVVKLGKDAENP